MTWLADLTGLLPAEIIALLVICFAAGLVRGFTGFALSALVMAVAVSFLPPVELIPILWFLEMTASVMLARGGWRDAERGTAVTLVLANAVGWPIGLWLTTSMPVSTSKVVVLLLVLALAATQLARIRIPWLATRAGTVTTGVTAGTVSGLAHVGGMIVALYALSRQSDARTMRGTLVTYLFLASVGSLFFQIAFGVMDTAAAMRAAVLIPPTALGVWLGHLLFTPRWQRYYRPFCLWLLIALAAVSLIRHLS